MPNRVSKIFQYLRDKLYSFLEFVKFLVIPQNKYLRRTLVGVVFVFVFGTITIAYAAPEPDIFDQIIGMLNVLLFWVASGLGWIAMKIFGIIVWVSSYNNFVTSAAVTKGWVLVRDICNMFFVVILLVIAFAQILGVQKYSMKTLLPKVLIAAILVNFSKLICGLMIDMAQVVMMTFVNGYQATAGANLIQGLGLTKLLSLSDQATSEGGGSGPKASEIFVAMLLACFVILATIFVSFFIALLLLMRIVTLWILVVLSPAAFMLSTVPFGQGKANEWWQKFGWTVAVGPFMAFFLWLSLLIMSDPEQMMGDGTLADSEAAIQSKDGKSTGEVSYLGNIAQAAIGLAMLMASLMAAQEAGGAMASLAQTGQKATTGALKKTAMRVSGAQSLQDRGMAAYSGYKAKKDEKMQTKMAKYKRLGTKAFAAKEKGIQGAKRVASLAVVKDVAKGIKSKRGDIKKAYTDARGAGGGGLKGVAARAKGLYAAAKTTGTGMKEGVQDGMKFGKLGSFNAAMAGGANKEAISEKNKEANEFLAKRGITSTADLQRVMETGTKAERGQAGLVLGERGAHTAETAKLTEKALKGDEESMLAYEASMKKKQAHLVYGDLTIPKNAKALASDIDSGDVDLSKLDSSAYEDADFMAAAQKAVGGKRFGKEIKKAADRSSKHKEIISETITSDDFSRAIIEDAKVALGEAVAANDLPDDDPNKAQAIKAAQSRVKETRGSVTNMGKTIASVTGDLNQSFAIRKQNYDERLPGYTDKAEEVGSVEMETGDDGNSVPVVDTDALGKFISNSSAKTIAGLKIEPNASVQVAQSIQVNKMKSLLSSSEDGATENFTEIMKEIVSQAQAGNKEMQAKALNMISIPDIKSSLAQEVQDAIEAFNPPAPRSAAVDTSTTTSSSSSSSSGATSTESSGDNSPLISTDTSQAAFDQARAQRPPNSWR